MSEQLKPTVENSAERLDVANETAANIERVSQAAREAKEHDNIEDLQANVEQHALSGQELSVESEDADGRTPHFGLHQELKKQAYNRTLNRVQSHLSKPERSFSKAIHSPVVDSSSNLLGKTIVRPSGVLGGGLAALVGSSYLLYSASHYGHEYNYTVFFLFFATGFFVGILVEALSKLLRR
jgi:hypothetical protein